ncbi:MAG: histidinol-phosphate transaminase [Gammaproteobacteria bacterium]|nr:MAG: histidinol-phosphate transaminase [Gammaproteobacteria bacterium]
MSTDFISLATASIQGMRPYLPGKPVEELEREMGLTNIIKLASNENPRGPSEKVLQAIQAGGSQLTRYPDGNGFQLKQKLAQHHGLDPDMITLGNGSNDVLELIARAFCNSSSEIIFSQYSFVVYALAAQAVGATSVVTKAHDWGHDLQAMAAAVTMRTGVIFLANPNNPTGTHFSAQALETFLQSVPSRVIVVLDEAYSEYVSQEEYPDGLKFMARYDNLVVTRTFSKAYGLAAMRVGFCVANTQITDVLNRVRQPFNVGSLGLLAACAAIDDSDYLSQSVAMNQQGMAQLESGFEQLKLEYIASLGNFVCVDLKRDAMPIYQSLLEKGVIVRPVANYGMPNHLRVSIGLESENQRFIEALGSVIKAL